MKWLIGQASRHRALAVGLTAQIVQYGSALLLIPFMVTRLSAPTIGIWYIFVTVQSLAMVCDFGFQPSFTRAIALALSGARKLERTGLGEAVPQDEQPNYRLAAEALAAAHRFYRLLALGVVVILVVCGLPYITMLAREGGIPTGSVQTAFGTKPAFSASTRRLSMVNLCEFSVWMVSPSAKSNTSMPNATRCARWLTRCISMRLNGAL